jgi:hypothetical protein
MPRRHTSIPALSLIPPSATCPVCDQPMLFHQPDPGTPERLVSTCPGCRAWFLIGEGGMVRLPIDEELRHIPSRSDLRDLAQPSQN